MEARLGHLCQNCHCEYEPRTPTQKYCSRRCMWANNGKYEREFWPRVDKDCGPVHPQHGRCWEWRGSRTIYGYGQYKTRGKTKRAHRLVYEMLVGPIPEGLTLDHLCRNRACVNPAHLEPVTNEVNLLRGMGLPAQNARKTHCKRGHEFTEENTYRCSQGNRHCRACQRVRLSKLTRRRPAHG